MEDPYREIHTPNALDVCLEEILYINFPSYFDGSVGVASSSDSLYLPSDFNLKSIIYHSIFFALTCPPVDFFAPAKIVRPFCSSLTVSSRGVSGVGATCMVM